MGNDVGPYKIEMEEIPWSSPAQCVRFKIYQRNGKQLRLVEFSKDFVEPDWCMKGHYGFVLEGEGDLDFNGQVIRYKKGDGIFIPPGEAGKHKLRVVTEMIRMILVEDY